VPKYRDIDGDSGVVAFECGEDWIEIEFRRGRERFYKYTNARAGAQNITRMKLLANDGEGLNAFINKNVAKLYSSKR